MVRHPSLSGLVPKILSVDEQYIWPDESGSSSVETETNEKDKGREQGEDAKARRRSRNDRWKCRITRVGGLVCRWSQCPEQPTHSSLFAILSLLEYPDLAIGHLSMIGRIHRKFCIQKKETTVYANDCLQRQLESPITQPFILKLGETLRTGGLAFHSRLWGIDLPWAKDTNAEDGSRSLLPYLRILFVLSFHLSHTYTYETNKLNNSIY